MGHVVYLPFNHAHAHQSPACADEIQGVENTTVNTCMVCTPTWESRGCDAGVANMVPGSGHAVGMCCFSMLMKLCRTCLLRLDADIWHSCGTLRERNTPSIAIDPAMVRITNKSRARPHNEGQPT